MLDWRCARGKRRKYSSKKRIVCQEEKRLFVKKQYERIGLSNGEEFLREKELNRNCLSERKEFFREEE